MAAATEAAAAAGGGGGVGGRHRRARGGAEAEPLVPPVASRGLPEGATPLMYACQQGRDGDVRRILATKPGCASDRDRTLKTALHYCAENASPSCASALLTACPSLLDACDEEGYTPVHLAVISGNRSLLRLLIDKGADVTRMDREGHSVVHWATVCGEVEALEMVIASGANPSTPDIHGGYPVHYAAQMCGANSASASVDPRVGLAVLRRLLAHKVKVDVVDKDGRQPILWAASAGSADAIIALVHAGATVEANDKDGLTALHCAASRGHTDCLETLVTLCGAEVDVIDANGCTALFYAATLGHADSTRLLLGFGAQPNRQDRKGRTAAHCGAAKGQLETLRLLVSVGGADIWIRNVRGDLPLHEAVQSGRRELVRWLLQQRPAAVNAANNDGRSPLHVAAIHNNVEMCKVLLDSHSLVNPVMRTPRGQMATPLDTALLRGNRGCAKFLQLHGGVPASKLTEESARLRGGTGGADGGSPAEMYLDHAGTVSARDPEGLGLQMLPLTQPVGGHDTPPPDGFRSEVYGGSVSRATTMYPDGHTTAASYRTTEDKFIQVNDDIAIQYVERIRLSENDGDQEEEMEELSLLRGKVSHRRLRGGEEEGVRSRREGEGTSEGEGGGGEVGTRRGRRSTTSTTKGGWGGGGKGRGCIREEEEEEESEEEEERESVSRKKKTRRKRTTKRKTTTAKTTAKNKEGLRRGRSREGDEEEEDEEDEEEGGEEEAEEEEEDDEDEDEEVLSEEEEREEEDERKYVGKKKKGGQQKVVQKMAASGREAKAEKRRAVHAVERTPSTRRNKPTSKAAPVKKAQGRHSTSPEKTDADDEKHLSSKIPVRRNSDRRPVIEERVTSKKRTQQNQHRSPDTTKKGAPSSASPASVGKISVKGEKSSKAMARKQKTISVDEGVVAEGRKGSVGRRKVGDGAEEEEGNEELPTDEDSPVKGTVQGKVQKVVAIVHKGGTSEEEAGSDEEEEVIEQEKVKEEEDEELDEGVVFEEGPSEREERKGEEESKEEVAAKGEDQEHEVGHVGEEHEEGNMTEGVTKHVVEKAPDHEVDSKEKVEEAKVQGKSEGEVTPVVEAEGGAAGRVNKKITNETAGVQSADAGGDGIAIDLTVSEKEEAVTEETEEGAKGDAVQATASEMYDEETARADEVEARKMAAPARVAERDVDKVTSESEDVTKDRTEDDVSQLAEDTVSMNEGRESPSKDEGISTFHLTGGRSESQEESEVMDGASTAEADVSIETIVAAGDRKVGATVCESEDEAEHLEDEEREDAEPEPQGKKQDEEENVEKDPKEEEGDGEGEQEEEEADEEEEEVEEGPSQPDEDGQRAVGEDRFGSSLESSIFIPSLPLDRETPTTSSRMVEDSETIGGRESRMKAPRRGGIMGRRRREKQKVGVRVEVGKDGAAAGAEEGQRERRPAVAANREMTGTTSVTQAVQTTVRKYHLERHIFSELLEMKRLQIRAGRANENVLVKRLVDNFHGPAGSDLTVGLKRYDGQYTFRNFEKYLYDQLRMLQTGDPHVVPKLKPSDEMDKLKKMRATTATTCGSTPDNPAMCTHVTHRCHHAAHAYTGVPCAAYITKGGGHHHHDHHLYPLHHSPSPQRSNTRSTAIGSFLPRIDTIQDQSPSPFGGGGTVRSRFLDPSRPVMLDLSQSGDRRQVISLPTQKVDKPKRYLVTFTIKPGSGSPDGVTITTKEGQVKVGPVKGDKSSPTLSDSPESDPTSFRHRHAKSL